MERCFCSSNCFVIDWVLWFGLADDSCVPEPGVLLEMFAEEVEAMAAMAGAEGCFEPDGN